MEHTGIRSEPVPHVSGVIAVIQDGQRGTALYGLGTSEPQHARIMLIVPGAKTLLSHRLIISCSDVQASAAMG